MKNYSKYDQKHWQNTLAYMRQTSRTFDRMIDRIMRLYGEIPQDVPFDINNYPGLKKGIDKELRRLAKELQDGIVNGVNNEWTLSNNKNDEVVNSMLKGRELPSRLQDRWMGRNIGALTAFTKRTEKGLGLSDRIWNITKGQAVDFERQMALGIYEGKPAKELATEMKRYLREPDKLFRRVRDEAGNLKLSKAAREFKPGAGRYRSSFKNALRMTRSETNRAYQEADYKRWEKMDFIIGVEVRRSNVPYDCDICAAAAGKYPKTYPWSDFEPDADGRTHQFHPHCRCIAIGIIAEEKQIMESIDAAFDEREYEFSGHVTEPPEKYVKFKERTGYKHF